MSLDPESNYYDAGGIETIEIIKAKLTPEQFQGWLLGNVIKYSTRLEHKGTRQRDAAKLKTYANLLNDEVMTIDAGTCIRTGRCIWWHDCPAPGNEFENLAVPKGEDCVFCGATEPMAFRLVE